MVRHQVVGRVEPHPAELRQQHIHPRVARVRRRPVVVLTAAVEIARHIAPIRISIMPQQRNHGVCKILAHSLVAHNRLVNRRIHPRGLRHVFEIVEQPLVQFLHQQQWIVPPRHFQLARQRDQRRRRCRKSARQQHLPVVPGVDQIVQRAPRIRSQKVRHVGHRLLLPPPTPPRSPVAYARWECRSAECCCPDGRDS